MREGLKVKPYHINVPSFGEWGFVMASRFLIKPEELEISVDCRFLRNDVLKGMFAFGGDVQRRPSLCNELDDPVLYGYYKQGWQRFND